MIDKENRLAELNVIARAERDEALRTLRDIAAVDPDEWPYDDGWACVEHIRRIAARAAQDFTSNSQPSPDA